MKYIKTFEDIKEKRTKYKVDDIVLYKKELYKIYYITRSKDNKIPIYHSCNLKNYYKVLFINRDIERKATTEELEELEIEKKLKKYNL